MPSTGTSLIFPLTCLVPLIKLHHHQSHTPPSPITNTTLNNHTTLTNHTLHTPISHKPHRSHSTLTNHTPPSPITHSTLNNHTPTLTNLTLHPHKSHTPPSPITLYHHKSHTPPSPISHSTLTNHILRHHQQCAKGSHGDRYNKACQQWP